MQLYRDLRPLATQPPFATPAFLSIGSFDGVHLGHQTLLRRMIAAARQAGALAGVITFDPHPRAVLRPAQPLVSLSTLDERLALLAALDLDFALVQPFDQELAQMSADGFATLLTIGLNLRQLWVGPDFALGYRRQGDVPYLRTLGARLGFEVEVVPPFRLDDVEVRSGAIRTLIAGGDVQAAARLLGRGYSLAGQIVQGDRRGTGLGFPTANLAPPPQRLLPAHGVYAAWAALPWERRAAVVNIGLRPTFDGQTPSVEAHLLDFDGDLYGQTLTLEFVQRLRAEQRFGSVQALIEQIRRDAEQARALLTILTPAVEQDARRRIYEELEHTADLAVRIFGATLPELFAHAGETFFRLLQAPFDAPTTVTRCIEVEGLDLEMLLVAWLQELLYAMETQGELYTQFTIEELAPPRADEAAHLRALVTGVPGRLPRSPIKAVTYHGLSVSQTGAGWQATVLFDT